MKQTTGSLTVISFPQMEKTKKEANFDRSMDSLVEVMSELFLVEKMTGRTGLPQRVYLAFSEALQSAMKLAEVHRG